MKLVASTSAAAAMHPIWQSGAILLAAAVAGALVLQLAAQRMLPTMLRQEHTVLGAAIFTVIGTTYAVLLAFMATTAWQQYSAAGDLARHEADALGNIYLLSRGLSEPSGGTVRSQTRAYAANVVDVEWPALVAGRDLPASEPLLVQLSRTIVGVVPADARETAAQAALIKYVGEVAVGRRDRRLASHGTIPDLVWLVLLSGGALMIGFSFLLGGPAPGVHLAMTAALVASGVLVILLIIGLSSPFRGPVTIPPDAYVQLLSEIQGPR